MTTVSLPPAAPPVQPLSARVAVWVFSEAVVMIPAWSTAAGSIPNLNLSSSMLHCLSQERLAKRINVLGQILSSSWNTTQAHTFCRVGQQCQLCEHHAPSPLCTLNEAWNGLQINLFFVSRTVTAKTKHLASATIDSEIKCYLDKKTITMKTTTKKKNTRKASSMNNFKEIRTPFTSQSIHNAIQVSKSVQCKERNCIV